MKLREAKLKNLTCQRRDSKDMLPVPKPDTEVLDYLKKRYPKCLVHIEGSLDDRARIEHSYWCHAGDWHIGGYKFYVDDDARKVYIVVGFGNELE